MTDLFTPFTLNNGVEIKNRLVVAPMTHFASNPDGTISDAERQFIGNRAQDFGLFITAATLVKHGGKSFMGEPEATSDAVLDSLRETANVIKNQGAKAILQLHHGGKKWNADINQGFDAIAPSDYVKPDNDASDNHSARAMTGAEVDEMIVAFARSAELALQAGFDGVEIHGANGYLIQQFVSGDSNTRTDKWGGDIHARTAFPLAVIQAVNEVKAKHNRPDFIVGYRFSPEEPEENGLTMADTFVLLDKLVEQPLQYLHISLWDFYNKARRGADTTKSRIEQIHDHIGGKLPLIGVGNLLSGADIRGAFETGFAEFIAVGKAVLMNPNLATLLKNNQDEQIATRLDLSQPEKYGYPPVLWHIQQNKPAFLPPVVGDENWQAVSV
ncbi:NADH-dependent flavin oxidoreductase [Moraxella equi]|nr:NADH-dependent flavin oxidoreductase [Moraxella equi]OPH37934.1 NADH-dependent flavin oxidoreductase [Moraxella equi]